MSDDNKQVATPEEVTAKVIEDFGFDPDTQGEQIEKVTNERIENQKNLSKTIEQKVSYREQGVRAGILDPETFKPIEKKPEGSQSLKTNQEPSVMTDERMALLVRDPNVSKLQFADEYSKVKGISLTEAYNSNVAQAEFREMDQNASIKANSLGASNGTAPAPRAKTVSNMTDDEHRALWEEKSNGAVNG